MMKQLTSMLLPAVFVVVASSIAYAQPKPKMTADEQALIALDKQWTAAELRLNDDDRKTIDRIVADEYVVRFFDGGKLAVMTHRGTVNGKPTYRSTHVWVKRGNNWQLIQNHVSNIGEPPATP